MATTRQNCSERSAVRASCLHDDHLGPAYGSEKCSEVRAFQLAVPLEMQPAQPFELHRVLSCLLFCPILHSSASILDQHRKLVVSHRLAKRAASHARPKVQ